MTFVGRRRPGLRTVLIAGATALAMACGGAPTQDSPPERPATSRSPAPAPTKPATMTTNSGAAPSMARQWATKVKATLDQTRLEEMMPQMPDDIAPEAARNGENRTFTWRFSDGSELLATFRPRGGEGSGAGLVLYMVDIKDGTSR